MFSPKLNAWVKFSYFLVFVFGEIPGSPEFIARYVIHLKNVYNLKSDLKFIVSVQG